MSIRRILYMFIHNIEATGSAFTLANRFMIDENQDLMSNKRNGSMNYGKYINLSFKIGYFKDKLISSYKKSEAAGEFGSSEIEDTLHVVKVGSI